MNLFTGSSIEETIVSINKNKKSRKSLNKIKRYFRRILLKQNDIRLFNYHLRNKTTPSQLFYENFPEPILPYDPDFIEKYNYTIQCFKYECMVISIQCLNNQIACITNNLEQIKNNNFSNIQNIDEVLTKIKFDLTNELSEEYFNKPEFLFQTQSNSYSPEYVDSSVKIESSSKVVMKSEPINQSTFYSFDDFKKECSEVCSIIAVCLAFIFFELLFFYSFEMILLWILM